MPVCRATAKIGWVTGGTMETTPTAPRGGLQTVVQADRKRQAGHRTVLRIDSDVLEATRWKWTSAVAAQGSDSPYRYACGYPLITAFSTAWII